MSTQFFLPLLVLALGCQTESKAPGSNLPATSSKAPTPSASTELLSAEARRDPDAVHARYLDSRDVGVRRAAARALGRSASPSLRPRLLETLSDSDPEVLAWSAFGLGQSCTSPDDSTLSALSVRAATLDAPDSSAFSLLDVHAALALALARCGGSKSESVLRGWLAAEAPFRKAAELGLGYLAAASKRLDDESLVALLRRASEPGSYALYPFTRLDAVSANYAEQLLQACRRALEQGETERAFAIRALSRAGEPGLKLLEEIALDERRAPTERVSAVRSLSLAKVQTSLERVFGGLGARLDADRDFALLLELVGALDGISDGTRATAERLAELSLTGSDAVQRRRIRLRCEAAALLAGTSSLSKRLLACDPNPAGRSGLLATLRVLDKGSLEGPRSSRFEKLATSNDAVVTQAALRLLGKHREVENASELLSRGLESTNSGIVATAAAVLAGNPNLANAHSDSTEPAPDARVIRALTQRLEDRSTELETLAAVIDASGALKLLGTKSRLEGYCKHGATTAREHAERALRLLGAPDVKCPPAATSAAPAELGRLPSARRIDLAFETESTTLSIALDPLLSPIAVTRFVELAKGGFFDGMPVHRVVPGFVVQIGDRDGDGFGGNEHAPIPCELSPTHFDTAAVGVALAGRDTGATQFFVTLGPYPHLDGEYTLVGHASPGWDTLAQGDVIRRVRVTP